MEGTYMQNFTIQDDLKNAIMSYHNIGVHSTVCAISFKNGFEIVGTYSCSKSEVDDNMLRQNRAYENALRNYKRHIEKRNSIYGGI
jgi:hypothetical protein